MLLVLASTIEFVNAIKFDEKVRVIIKVGKNFDIRCIKALGGTIQFKSMKSSMTSF